MQSLLTNPLVVSYAPMALAAIGVAAYSYFKRPPSGPDGVVDLLNAVDDLMLEFMRDGAAPSMSDATKKAFLEVVTAKGIVRRSASA